MQAQDLPLQYLIMEILRAENVSLVKQFKGIKKTVFENISLTVNSGECLAVIGPSGGGKTSLLRLFNRLDNPTGGIVFFKEKPADSYEVTGLRLAVSMVAQTPDLITDDILEDLNYGYKRKYEKSLSREEIIKRLPGAGLPEDIFDHKPQNLSGGEKQKIAILRSLLVDPGALLLDEPASALDIGSKEAVLSSLKTFRNTENKAMILVSHDLDFAGSLATHGIILKNNSIKEYGPIGTILKSPLLEEIKNSWNKR